MQEDSSPWLIKFEHFFTSWIFAKSVTNAAKSWRYYGLVAAWLMPCIGWVNALTGFRGSLCAGVMPPLAR
jgi:hypothetical protein